jgi:hypothetical protein
MRITFDQNFFLKDLLQRKCLKHVRVKVTEFFPLTYLNKYLYNGKKGNKSEYKQQQGKSLKKHCDNQ